VCSSTGEGLSHSIEVGWEYEKIHARLFASPSHRIHINIVTDRNEIREPSEETTFHVVKQSG